LHAHSAGGSVEPCGQFDDSGMGRVGLAAAEAVVEVEGDDRLVAGPVTAVGRHAARLAAPPRSTRAPPRPRRRGIEPRRRHHPAARRSSPPPHPPPAQPPPPPPAPAAPPGSQPLAAGTTDAPAATPSSLESPAPPR